MKKKIKVPVNVEFNPMEGAIGYKIQVNVVAEFLHHTSNASETHVVIVDIRGNKLGTKVVK